MTDLSNLSLRIALIMLWCRKIVVIYVCNPDDDLIHLLHGFYAFVRRNSLEAPPQRSSFSSKLSCYQLNFRNSPS